MQCQRGLRGPGYHALSSENHRTVRHIDAGSCQLNKMYPSASQASKMLLTVSSTHHRKLLSAEAVLRGKPMGCDLVMPLQLPDGIPWPCHREVRKAGGQTWHAVPSSCELSNYQSAALLQHIADRRAPVYQTEQGNTPCAGSMAGGKLHLAPCTVDCHLKLCDIGTQPAEILADCHDKAWRLDPCQRHRICCQPAGFAQAEGWTEGSLACCCGCHQTKLNTVVHTDSIQQGTFWDTCM